MNIKNRIRGIFLGIAATALLSLQVEAQCQSFAGTDYSQGIVFVMEKGKIVWQHKAPESNDLWVLPNGNLLFTVGTGVLEMTRQNDTVFYYQSKSPIFACQRLANGNTFIGECGNGRLLEVSPEGKIVKTVSILPEGKETGDFAFMRNARYLDNGHFLVAHYGSERVTEYDSNGRIVWNVAVPGGPHSVVRLPDGHTMVAVADRTQNPRLIELDPQGNVVWEFSNADVPDRSLKFLGGLHCLEDGRILFTNWVGHENPEKRTHLYMIDKDKRIICTLKNHDGIETMSSVYSMTEKGYH